MKYYILLLAILFTPFVSISQSKSMKAIIQVDGVCGMCKNRIEKACLKTKGVKHASWSIETHKLDLIYDTRKVDLSSIEKNIAAVGHDTKNFKADDESYDMLYPCCKYRDPEVIKNHK